MRRLVFHGPSRLTVEEADDPPLRHGEVRVASRAVGICGSDVHGYTGVNSRRLPGTVMGHEAAGVVVEIANNVGELEIGQPVAINPAVTCGKCDFCVRGQDHRCLERRLHGCAPDLPGAFAERLVVPGLNAIAWRGPAPLEWGALVEPLAVAAHGVGLLPSPQPGSLIVFGGGPIGLGAALAARRHGIGRVVICEPQPHRRQVAGELGFESVVPGDTAIYDQFDAAIDCVAARGTIDAALASTHPGGAVIVIGLGETTVPLSVERLVVGEHRIHGSYNYTRSEFTDTVRWAESGEIDLSAFVERTVSLDQLASMFEGYADGTVDAIKTVFIQEAPVLAAAR